MQAEDAISERGRGARTKRPAGGTRALEAPETSRDSISRQRVIDAAIQCILDRGFYRASSNAIAESAGVTWGVIQYHFGTREALMLAVLEQGARQLNEILRAAEITGDTVTERIAQYADILTSYYGSPQYLAYTQVLINLSHDPRTSQQARATMAGIGESANVELNRLQREVLAGTGTPRPEVRSLLFHALRGLSLSHMMLDTVPDYQGQWRQFPEQRRLLAEALGMLIEAQPEEAQPEKAKPERLSAWPLRLCGPRE